MADHDEEREKAEVYKVDTVPPPEGEDDAYSAPTRVGPMAEAAAQELMRQAEIASGLAPGSLSGGASGPPTKPPPVSKPASPPSSKGRSRLFASNTSNGPSAPAPEPVELAPEALVEEAAPPPRVYDDDDDDAPAFPPPSRQPASQAGPPPSSGKGTGTARIELPAARPNAAPIIVGGESPMPAYAWKVALGIGGAALLIALLVALFR
jgi:hypothetical protein